MLVNCTNCRTPLQLPPGATSIRCAICHAVTLIAADPRTFPAHPSMPPPPPAAPTPYANNYNNYYRPPPPSPYNHAPAGQLPSQHGRKRAVIIGISYKNSRQELKGCVNDANCMKFLLINRYKFPQDSILMLTGKTFSLITKSFIIFIFFITIISDCFQLPFSFIH